MQDVVIVGAGLAGLSAARELARRGRTVLVVEARARVGGRTFDVQVDDGHRVEMGGQWIADAQSHVSALVNELGLRTFRTFSRGDALYESRGHMRRYDGMLPPAGLRILSDARAAMRRLDRLASDVDHGTPWTAKRAADLDARSVGEFLRAACFTAGARRLLSLAVRAVYGEDPAQVSLLDLLAAISGVGGSIETLIEDAQSRRIVGGTQQLSTRLAEELGDRVRLEWPVDSLSAHTDEDVVVSSEGRMIRARAVILALPKAMISKIRFFPDLPPNRTQLLQRQPFGATIKVNVVYRTPFWRAANLSGTVLSVDGPIELTYDNSPEHGDIGVIVGFFEGQAARAHADRSASERREVVLSSLARFFGSEAGVPLSYHEVVWANERYTGGAYGSFNPPGVLTGVAPYVEAVDPRIIFAGADVATEWPGYLDGAISNGTQSAEQVDAWLGHEPRVTR